MASSAVAAFLILAFAVIGNCGIAVMRRHLTRET
jgi:hypothetical protein